MELLTEQQKENLKQEIKGHVDQYRQDHFYDNYPSGQGHINDWVWIALTEYSADQFMLINSLKEQVQSLKEERDTLQELCNKAKAKKTTA